MSCICCCWTITCVRNKSERKPNSKRQKGNKSERKPNLKGQKGKEREEPVEEKKPPGPENIKNKDSLEELIDAELKLLEDNDKPRNDPAEVRPSSPHPGKEITKSPDSSFSF